jgi:hypothetical protein
LKQKQGDGLPVLPVFWTWTVVPVSLCNCIG